MPQDASLDIDHTCHNLHNNTADIQLHGGIERQNGGLADTVSWERTSDKNVQDAQSIKTFQRKTNTPIFLFRNTSQE